MKFYKKYKKVIFGIVIGAFVGYGYYHFVGCNKNCMITSKPLNASLYGALMGGLFLNMFEKKKPK